MTIKITKKHDIESVEKKMTEKIKKKHNIPKDGSEDSYTQLIPLHNFKLNHNTCNEMEQSMPARYVDSRFVGRDMIMKQLYELLIHTNKDRGSYLVAGYRGSGKTSLINRVINRYESYVKDKKRKKLIIAKINLGHDEILDARHVLFNIVSVLKHEFNNCYKKEKEKCKNVICKLITVFVMSVLVLSVLIGWLGFIGWSPVSEILCLDQSILFIYLVSIILLFVVFYTNNACRKNILTMMHIGKPTTTNKNIYQLVEKINSLYNKVAYSFEKDIGVGSASKRYAGITFNEKTNIPEMREPQIELELINFLKFSSDNEFQVILIFDELDKISLTVTESSVLHSIGNKESVDMLDNETIDETIYRRKKRVDALLASLKVLITVGQARFFFIAGRDILDSYQSEKGSTSSLYESLFDQVFEVPSFLTDDSDQRKTRLHSMIEVYVCSRILKPEVAERYWLANQLCGQLINDDSFKEEISKYCKNIVSEKSCSKLTEIVNNELLKRLIDTGYFGHVFVSCKKFTFYRDMKSLFDRDIMKLTDDLSYKVIGKTELSYNEKFMYVVSFVREICILYLGNEKLKVIVQKSKFSENANMNHVTEINYNLPRLNVYYLYLLHNKISKREAETVINTLHQFINYLTIHSWGNCKRLSSLFESFIKPQSMTGSIHNLISKLPTNNEKDYMLHFGIIERQRICMGSNLYIMFNHHLSRQFTGADKLLVSTMAAMHYCLKFHRSAFSRHHLFRMTEMMSIYSSPELNSIFETTLTQVVWPYIRVIRNGMLQYRFFTWIEQEIRYIARVNDLESASYTFSLDSINNIKAHYQKTLSNVMSTYKVIKSSKEERGPGLVAEINIVLGDIYLLERAYDESVVYYQTAVNAYHTLDVSETNNHPEGLLRYIEALLKLGNVQEHRQRYDRAAMNYQQAMNLVDGFFNSNSPENGSNNDKYDKYVSAHTESDSKWVLLEQPYWALFYLDLKKTLFHYENVVVPKNLYGENDPNGEYRKAQLLFFLGNHVHSHDSYVKVIRFFEDKTNITKLERYHNFYLFPTALINISENALISWTNNLKNDFELNPDWIFNNHKLCLYEECVNFLSSMADVKSFSDLEIENYMIINIVSSSFDMREILQLIFHAAKIYKENKLYDHAAMAYLKAISLWATVLDMLSINCHGNYTFIDYSPLSYPLGNKNKIESILRNMHLWYVEASEKASQTIRDSNGQAQQQAREKWHIRDLADYPNKTNFTNTDQLGLKKIEKLLEYDGRKQLGDDIAFWEGSYLGQQLIVIQSWIFTIKRTILGERPDPLKSYRMPVYTTRPLILSSWANGRERLEQARRISVRILSSTKVDRYIYKVYDIKKQHLPDLDTDLYIKSSKGIHNFYNALHYTNILIDNNQSIIFPTPSFVLLHLWILLLNLVQYEINFRSSSGDNVPKKDKEFYHQCRLKVRAKLMKYVSRDMPTRHLDLDFVAQEAIRLLQSHVNMDNLSSTVSINILHNKYYLNDDHEDPGFHLDWTITQMLIPSAMMSIKWIEDEMAEIKKSTR